jgi:hypothetical protein
MQLHGGKHIFFPGLLLFGLIMGLMTGSCKKTGPASGDTAFKLSYGDSILYLQSQPGDRIVSPVQHRPGSYSSFPEGLILDPNTGAINVTQSETGLRYRVTHTDPNGVKTNTYVVISGLNYADKLFNISTGDSIIYPVYNADPNRPLPLTGSEFDINGEAVNAGCAINAVNGSINLSQSVRDELFGNNPENDDKIEVDVVYRLNDQSGKAMNKVRVKLYYYTSVNTVTQEMWQTLAEREQQGVFLQAGLGDDPGPAAVFTAKAVARPRPPCIVIIAN